MEMPKSLNNLYGIVLFSKSEAELTEKDYSMKRLLDVARSKGVKLDIVHPNNFELVVTRSDKKSILIENKTAIVPDFVIPRTGSGTTYYALSVIRQLEHMGICVINGANSIEMVKDKLHLHQILAHSKIPTPKTMLAKFPINISLVKQEIGFPLIIKNITGSYGNGIYLCDSEEKFEDVMELIYTNNEKANIIIQEFIKTSKGKDLRVFVVGGKVIACMQRSSSVSFKANYSRGGEVAPYVISPEIEYLSTEVAKLVNLDIAGIDLLFDGNGFKVCEANSAPDFKGLESAVGSHIAEDIIDFVLLKTNQYKQ